ncbi:serine hydrolase domain-containing protein [Pseudidiomarina homiensis]|uniref:serine hydrolase domain-containing protein n=1 Tax=Pseudidiomarina homiensis TaxID=364198 RepID=UPI00215A27F1|nr:beta-lactamase family protein [Pseudidiomarina homiensis]
MKLRFALIALSLLAPMYAAQATSSLDEHQRKADRIEQGLTPIYSITGETPKHSIQDFMERDNIPGVSITFIDSGRIAWSRTYGYADVAAQVPVTTDTVFTAASVSKPVSATAALALVDQGVMDIDTDVNSYLEGWQVPENEYTQDEKVTLRRLLSHTAGFDRYFHSRYAPGVQRPTVEQMLRGEAPSKDRGAKMIYEPGSGYKYSNPGYLVVEELITDVTDQPFEKVLDERVLQPAGMQSSSFAQPITGDLAERKATGYSANGKPYPYAAYAFKALGGLWTTPNDLGRWLITLLNDHHTGDATLLSQKLTQQVFNEQGDRLIFSLWAWKDDIVFRHTGHNPGFTSFVFGSVDKQQALIVMTNSDNTQDLFDHLQRAVADTYQWDYFRSEVFDVYKGETIDRRKASLQYDWNGQYVNFSEEKTGFYMQINNERFLLTPIAANEFLAQEKSIKVIFNEENLDQVTIWKANGDRDTAQRM